MYCQGQDPSPALDGRALSRVGYVSFFWATMRYARFPGQTNGTIIALWDVYGASDGSPPNSQWRSVSDIEQQGSVGAALDEPFVVLARDQNGNPVEGVRVDFKVTTGGGTLSVTSATTDANGHASTILTLGSQPGTNTVVVTVADLDPVTFTATGKAHADFDGDGAVGFRRLRAVRGKIRAESGRRGVRRAV